MILPILRRVTYLFTLPSHFSLRYPPVQQDEEQEEKMRDMAGEAILFVDDEPHMGFLVAETLAPVGYRVTTVTSGYESLALLASQSFDVLLTDLKMPEMSGMTLLEQARIVAPAMAMIVVTAYPALTSARQALQAGASDYILKPFALNQLVLVVQRCLERKQLPCALHQEEGDDALCLPSGLTTSPPD